MTADKIATTLNVLQSVDLHAKDDDITHVAATPGFLPTFASPPNSIAPLADLLSRQKIRTDARRNLVP